QAVIIDLRDQPLTPHRGVYAELRAEEGTPAAGGAFAYLRLTPEARAYLPLGSLVVAGRLRVGGIAGDLPVTQRYFSGGASNHRGFAERRLAPVVTGTVDGETRSVVIGGGGLVETGAELRAPLGRVRSFDLGGVLFADGGDVTERLRDIEPAHLHWAVGTGLRVATVIGPVRFDVGYRVNRAAGLSTLDRMAFHLNLGEAF
ncbi:MAG TPA: BamA/TamA family outer membrane protein, partial [Kofleriaceae bacterium]|nr:BamA/TamA family outer membrane protein [Kofleriaceae bacterium]